MSPGGERSGPRALLLAAALLLVVVAGLVPATTAAAGRAPAAQQTTTTAADPPSIIPEPDSGTEPEDAGDRGGALQSALLVLMVVAVIGIGAAVVRQSRRARAERGF